MMHTKDQALIEAAISLISKYGAKEHAEEVARKIVTDAWASVDPLLQPSDAKDKIKGNRFPDKPFAIN